ncbi:hypothetical protein AAFF_G00219580 [Aldrovandia affinis]|uniref:G-protein coupled receptors family 1 profile domain-containing protein n=1 Tax=Aldrovandia affinis TaxID=143900 RepID=A0AAD7W4X4_9TELE|nr:hypothetical protein AAFF_G00219580 [Aldrovandia affinis]
MKSPMVRKFAFHMILAGHRFSKAGQKRHALRCYCQAMQVYKCKGWSLAEDHINFTIGRQSFTLRQPENAVSAFRHILINDSKQAASQQAAFLREYLYVYKNVSQSSPEGALPQLPLPCIQSSLTRVFFGHDRRLAEGEKQAATHVSLDQEYDRDLSQQWKELEEQVVAIVHRGVPASFQPTQYCLNSQTDNTRFPLAVVEEPIVVEVVFRNPLKIPLVLADLSLLWRFTPKDFSRPQDGEAGEAGEAASNEKDAHLVKATLKSEFITTEVISEFFMTLEETKVARLKLLPHQTGELHILGVVYNLGTVPSAGEGGKGSSHREGSEGAPVSDGMTVRGRQDLEIQGPRLNATKEEKTSVQHGPDRRLDPIIAPPMPLLEVFFINFPTGLLCGEIRKAYVEFANVSAVPLTGLRVVSRRPEFFTFGSRAAPVTPLSPAASENCSAYKTVVPEGERPAPALVCPGDFGAGRDGQCPGVLGIPLPDSVLLPGASVQLPMWLRGPDREGVHEINFLFYYESAEKTSKLSHRVLRHTAVICASRSLSVRATVRRSNTFQDRADGRHGSMLVFVDVENINTSESGVREFHIVQVSSSSKQWRLHKCINLSEDKDSKLTSRERGKLCFRATKCRSIEATSNAQEKYTFADINLGNEQIISATTPCADFFFNAPHKAQENDQRGATRASHSPQIISATTPWAGGAADVSGVVRRCSEVDLNVIVLWKAYVVEDNKQLILEGQLHVALQTIGKEACSLTQKEEAQEMVLLKFKPDHPPPLARPSMEQLSHLIKTNLHYLESYNHPFPQRSLCMVPVTLRLSNCSLAEVDVIIDLRHKATSPESLEVHGSFTWLGQTQYKLQLKAQEIHKLQLTACFIHAGVYNLGTPRVFAKLSDQGSMCETSQQNSMPALIIINSSCDSSSGCNSAHTKVTGGKHGSNSTILCGPSSARDGDEGFPSKSAKNMGKSADNTTFHSNIPEAADIVVAIVYSIFGICSLLGNSMLLYVSYKKKHLLKPAEFFIVNLAISDLGMTVSLYPLAITSSIYHRWLYGKTMCLIYAFCGVLFGVCSLTTLTVLSTVCCMKVCYPLYGNRFTHEHGRLLIACVWAYALVFACSPLAHWGEYGPEPYGTACCIDWTSSNRQATARSYTVALFVFCYIVPCAVIVSSYTQILATVRESRKAVEQHLSTQTHMSNIQTIIVKLSVAVCIGFFAAWSPYALVSMWAAFGRVEDIPPMAFAVPAVFAKSSTLYNPVVYLLLKPNFRHIVCKDFRRLQKVCHSRCFCPKRLQKCNYRSVIEVSLRTLKKRSESSSTSVHIGPGCSNCTCERGNDTFECFRNYPRGCQVNVNTVQFSLRESASAAEPERHPKIRQATKKSVRVIVRGKKNSEIDSLEITLETVPTQADPACP